MRAKLDENLPVEAAELLRTAGWECDTVYDEGLAGHRSQRRLSVRFLADESYDFAVVTALRAAGHDVTVVAESALACREQHCHGAPRNAGSDRCG
jgi:hypothetical protein